MQWCFMLLRMCVASAYFPKIRNKYILFLLPLQLRKLKGTKPKPPKPVKSSLFALLQAKAL